jgi:hypothetical protein
MAWVQNCKFTRPGPTQTSCGGSLHDEYQESVQKSGLVKEMLATYHDLISQLEPLRMASPTKYHLARAYRRIIKNEVEAKELLY